MMTQQEFDATCVEIRTSLKQLLSNLSNERLLAQHKMKNEIMIIQQQKDIVIREFRNVIYDLATASSVRSSAFVAGQSEAKAKRDEELSKLDAKVHQLQDEFFVKCQELRKIGDKARREADDRKADAIRQHHEWLEMRRAEKAAQEGGQPC